jgi:RNA polymerase sigma-70 factor (family 1)
MRSIPDEQFVAWSEGLRRSDRKAYAAVFEATYDTLFGFARYITRDEEAAQDILQDVYLKLWQVRETVDPTRSLRALLFQMVRNYALNHERRKKTHATDSLDLSLVEPSVETTAEADLDTSALGDRLRVWIEEMPERRREAFMLSRFEGLSHEEIARVMNLTPRTVNNHIVLALQDLRGRLHAYETDNIEP